MKSNVDQNCLYYNQLNLHRSIINDKSYKKICIIPLYDSQQYNSICSMYYNKKMITVDGVITINNFNLTKKKYLIQNMICWHCLNQHCTIITHDDRIFFSIHFVLLSTFQHTNWKRIYFFWFIIIIFRLKLKCCRFICSYMLWELFILLNERMIIKSASVYMSMNYTCKNM